MIELWDLRTGTPKTSWKGHDTNTAVSLAFTRDSRTLISGSWQNMKTWNLNTYAEQKMVWQSNPRVALSPSGRLLAAGGNLPVGITFRTIPELKELLTIRGHKDAVWTVAFSPDSKTLATASWDGTVKLWHVATGQELLSFNAGGGVAWSVAFSPDSRLLAFGSGSASKSEITLVRSATRDDVLKEHAAELRPSPKANLRALNP